MIQQLGPAVDPALVSGQVVKEPELGCGKFNRLAGADHLVPRGVDHQVANRDPVARSVLLLEIRPAQQSLHPGHQFPDLEWLGDVIIGSDTEAENDINLLALGGNHDDGDPPRAVILFQVATDLDSIHPWKHDVQQHEVGLQLLRLLETLEPIHATGYLVTLLLEVVLNDLEYIFLILDNQYR